MSGTLITVSSKVRRPIRTRWLALGALLGLALIGAACYHYWVQWRENRFNEHYRSHAYHRALGGFITNLQQGRLDEVYDGATAEFQRSVSRKELERMAHDLRRLDDKPGTRLIAGTPGGPINRGYRAKQVVTDKYTLQDREGNRLDVSSTVVIVDSILYSHPRTPLVDGFSVTYTPVGGKQR
jgi:hypothetical protein